MLARSIGRIALALVTVVALAGCERRVEQAACTPEPKAAAKPPVDTPTAPPASEPPAPTPPSAQAASPSRPPPAPAAELPKATRLRVKRLVLAEGVDAREPVGARSAFRADEMDKVYAFVEVENPEQVGGAITVSFEPPTGPAIGNVRLAVGASTRWRTWAYSRSVRETGEWTAVVRDDAGRVIAREPFSVTL